MCVIGILMVTSLKALCSHGRRDEKSHTYLIKLAFPLCHKEHSLHIVGWILGASIFTARKYLFRKVLFCAASVFSFFFFFMFAGTLSLERLDRSQPNFHTRWRGGLAQTLFKMGVIAWAVWQPSWKTLFSHNYDCSSSTDCTGVAFTSAQPLTIHSIQCIHFICLKIISIVRAPGGLILTSSSFL